MTTYTRDELKRLLDKTVLLKEGATYEQKEFEYYKTIMNSIKVILSRPVPIRKGYNVGNGMNSPSETQRRAYSMLEGGNR